MDRTRRTRRSASWLLRLGIGLNHRPSLSSSDAGQGRALPPHAEGRTAGRSARSRRSRATASGPSTAGASSTTGSGPTRPSTDVPAARFRPAASLPRGPAAHRVRARTSGPCKGRCKIFKLPKAFAGYPVGLVPTTHDGTASQAARSRNSTCEMAQSKLLPMSPNTCNPCPRSQVARGDSSRTISLHLLQGEGRDGGS